MKRIGLSLVLILSLAGPSWAIFGAIIEGGRAAKDVIYQKFMMLKAVQQLKALRDNYQSSKRHYAMFKRMNEGKGFLYNVSNRIADIGVETVQEAQAQFEDDWIYGPGYGADVDRLMERMDNYASNRIRYAAKSFEKFVEAQKEAEKIALGADGLDSKSTQRMILKTQALQLQLAAQTSANIAQLLDVNTRLYKLQLEQKQNQIKDWDLFDKSIRTLNLGSGRWKR